MSIKRYCVQGFKDAVPASNGKYVLLEDHSAIVAALQEQVLGLKEQVLALAAENGTLKSAIATANSEVQEHYDTEGVDSVDVEGNFMDACIRLCDAQSTIDKLENIETPATDAALREIGASGAEAVAEYHKERFEFLEHTRRDMAGEHKAAYLVALDVAAKLRAGEQL